MINFFKNLFRYNIVKLLLLVFFILLVGYAVFTCAAVRS